MAKRFFYQCNICGTESRSKVVSESCSCGGKYIPMTITPKKLTKSGQGMTKQPGIRLKRRKTKGYQRSK